MAVNGPSNMYTVEQIYESHTKIELPTCMYRLKNVYDEDLHTPAFVEEDEANVSNDIEKHQLKILERLEDLKSQVLHIKKNLGMPSVDTSKATYTNKDSFNASSPVKEKVFMKYHDIVIKANPEYPPYSLWVYQHLLGEVLNVQLVTYCHSTLASFPKSVHHLSAVKDIGQFDLTITVIWRQTLFKDAEMMVDPIHQGIIEGEVNIARYLSRLLHPECENNPFEAALIDNWLTMAHSSLIHGSSKDKNAFFKTMNSQLGQQMYLTGDKFSVADIVLWSLIPQYDLLQNLPSNVTKWWANLNSIAAFQLPVAA